MNARHHKKNKLNLFNRPVTKLLFRLVMVLLLFSVSRWLIYLFNTEFFHHLTLRQALRLYLVGMRFDLVVIACANAPLILYYCLPFKFIYSWLLQRIMGIYYVVVNSAIIILNMADVIYFRFFGKRMTREFFIHLGDSMEEFGTMANQIVMNYWPILVLMALFTLVLVAVNRHSRLNPKQAEDDPHWAFVQWLSLIVFAALTPVAVRGGLQEKPIGMTTAMHYADSQNVPIVLNTPFILMKSAAKPELQERHYEGLEEVSFSPVHFSNETNRFVSDSLDFTPNLMYIVLEGIGQEMIGYYNPDRRYALTSFLDELMRQSLTFDGRANGRRPIEALPSLLSGIPSLMDVDFLSSPYANNRVDDLPSLLANRGYATAMFRDQYPTAALHTLNPPFAAIVYPSDIPGNVELPQEAYLWSGFEKEVYRTDCTLRDFFDKATQMPWFDSTLFVITADHANTEHYLPEYSNVWGMYSIPVAFHMPLWIEPHRCQELAQQIDLNLSILAVLGMNDTLFSFGRNLFDTLTQPSSIAYINQTYQYSDGQYLLQSDGDNTIGVFNIRRDRQLDDNLIDRIQCEDIAIILKKNIQEYNNRIINNQLFVDKEAYHEQAKDTLYLEPCSGEVEEE